MKLRSKAHLPIQPANKNSKLGVNSQFSRRTLTLRRRKSSITTLDIKETDEMEGIEITGEEIATAKTTGTRTAQIRGTADLTIAKKSQLMKELHWA